MKQRGQRGMGRIYLRNEIWWVQFSVNGIRHRESSNSSDKADAMRLLKRRSHEAQSGKSMGVASVRFDDLSALLLNDYKVNGRRSIERASLALNRLREYFGGDCKASDITSDRVGAYQAHRLERGVASGTINYESACLRRMLRLAVDAGKLTVAPKVKMLTLHNVRKGFFEREQYEAVLRYLPDYLKPVITTAYITGWRTRSELLTRRWRDIDFEGGWMRLEPGEGKTGEGRSFPLVPELRAILEAQRERVRSLERTLGRVIANVFVHDDDGRPIGDFRYAWKRACRLAGVPGRIPHDFRRTAVRNLERAGASRSASMKMSGHKTESIFRRYAISDSAVLQEAGEKLSRWLAVK